MPFAIRPDRTDSTGAGVFGHRARIKAFTSIAGTLLAFGMAACTPVPDDVAAIGQNPAPAESPSAAGESDPVPPATPDISNPSVPAALDALEARAVKGRAPKTGYDRDQFGPAWADVDRNGCDSRNDVLARDLTGETFKPGTNDCVVTAGVLADPYTGRKIDFVKGGDALVDIDHVVALGNAWVTGAQQLSPEARRDFANDPLNLLAVDGPANRQKGDADAATWLPANKAFRCEYVARQTAVKAKYQLWVTTAERDAIAKVLASCPDQPLPEDSQTVSAVPPSPGTPVESPPAPKAPVGEATATQAPPSGHVSYASCAEVRAAGAAPIRAGDPGFDAKFDRDGDGVGCQS